jgi:hypothetical protein
VKTLKSNSLIRSSHTVTGSLVTTTRSTPTRCTVRSALPLSSPSHQTAETSTTHQIRPANLSTDSESHSPSPSHRSTSLPDAHLRSFTPSRIARGHGPTTTIHDYECTQHASTDHDAQPVLHQSPATQPSPTGRPSSVITLSLSRLPALLSDPWPFAGRVG